MRRRGSLHQDLVHVVALAQPFSHAIRKLEADRPALSEVLSTWDDLDAHVKAWTKRRGVSASLSKGVYQRFKMRFKAHYSPAFAAAQLVDPAFFKVVGEDQIMMPFESLATLSPMCYEDNCRDNQIDFEQQQQQQQGEGSRRQNRKWTRLEDAENCMAELAGPDAPKFRAEFRRAMLLPFSGILGKVGCTAVGLSGDDTEMEEQGDARPAQRRTDVRERVIFWSVWCKQHGFPALAAVAVKLLSMHPTSCASERNWSVMGQLYSKARCSLALERARKLVYERCNTVDREQLEELEPVLELLGLQDA